jgi:hypothetical protein
VLQIVVACPELTYGDCSRVLQFSIEKEAPPSMWRRFSFVRWKR